MEQIVRNWACPNSVYQALFFSSLTHESLGTRLLLMLPYYIYPEEEDIIRYCNFTRMKTCIWDCCGWWVVLLHGSSLELYCLSLATRNTLAMSFCCLWEKLYYRWCHYIGSLHMWYDVIDNLKVFWSPCFVLGATVCAVFCWFLAFLYTYGKIIHTYMECVVCGRFLCVAE